MQSQLNALYTSPFNISQSKFNCYFFVSPPPFLLKLYIVIYLALSIFIKNTTKTTSHPVHHLVEI